MKWINEVNYKLVLLIYKGRLIYPIFHILLLEKANQTVLKINKKNYTQ